MAQGAALLGPTIGKQFSPEGTGLVFASHDLPASEVLGLLVIKDPLQSLMRVDHRLDGFAEPVLALDAQQEFRHGVHPLQRRGRIGEYDSLGEGIEQGLDLVSVQDFLQVGVPLYSGSSG